jgi:mycothiol synthase
MQSKVSIIPFDWKYTDAVIKFLNKVTEVKNTEKEISKVLFTQYHNLPGSNPLKDCFIATTKHDEIVGFLHLIFERGINRAVAIAKTFSTDQKKLILSDFTDISIAFATSRNASILHTQIENTDISTIEEFKKKWLPVKEYWNLKCTLTNLSNSGNIILPEGYTVERLNPVTDIGILTYIQNISFENHWGFCPNTEEEIEARVKMENSDPEGILLIKHAGEIAGYNWTMLSSKGKNSTGWITMTGVSPKYRGRGLGELVVTLGMDYLFKKGVGTIELEVDSSNAPALTLYTKLGFKKVSASTWFQKI